VAARLSDDEAKLVIAALNDSIDKTDPKVMAVTTDHILRQQALEKANRMRRLRSRLTANLQGRGVL
jgi:hypothetical protein